MSGTARALTLLLLLAGCATVAPVASVAPVAEKETAVETTPPELLSERCHMGDRPSCAELGDRYLHGVGVERSPGLAVALYLLACDQGDARACASAGHVYATDADSADKAAAARCFRKACSLGDEQSCTVHVDRRTAGKPQRTSSK